MYRLIYERRAARVLQKLPRNLARRIQAKLNAVAADPHQAHRNVTALQGRPGYRLRVGDWRILYRLDNAQLVVLGARHRRPWRY